MENRAEALIIELQNGVRRIFRSATETFSVRLRKLFPHASEYFSVSFGNFFRTVTENSADAKPLLHSGSLSGIQVNVCGCR